ncbi:hypothetical protein PPACK8108_LOCUS25320 [Phakopsora pachyrhizi]|uniref:eRF1 domain-containing protein n=1 Tax=Phakopsora pachyrhizi TaxID=170000 RepID=A0AAV0BTV0_PHAPC|nr:hypothetical protein PPACK8108_LOCUS25320 [Phakopsora pachyrhizi]
MKSRIGHLMKYKALKDETNDTVDDPWNIANSLFSGSQRATKSVGIATPTYYANLLATRAKKWDISDENASTFFTTNSGTQTSGERHCEFDYFKNRINKMNEKVKLISHQIHKSEVTQETAIDEPGSGRGAELAAILCDDTGKAPICLISPHTTLIKKRIEVTIPKKKQPGQGSDKSMEKFYKQIFDQSSQRDGTKMA